MTQHGFWGYLMKSTQQENWAKTSCRDCKLSKFEEQNGKLSQVGCELGRLSKFEDLLTHAHDDEKEFYIINDACNYYTLLDSELSAEEVKDSKKNKFAVVVFADEENDDVLTTVNSILDIDYDRKKMFVVIAHRYVSEGIVKSNTLKGAQKLFKEGVGSTVVVLSNDGDMDFESFKNTAGYNFCTRIFGGQTISPNTFKNIDTALNEDLKKCVYFEDGGVNVIMRKVISARYLDYNDYLLFEEGVKEEAESHGLFIRLENA